MELVGIAGASSAGVEGAEGMEGVGWEDKFSSVVTVESVDNAGELEVEVEDFAEDLETPESGGPK